MISKEPNNIKVFIRVRPFSQAESQFDTSSKCIECVDSKQVKVTNYEGVGPSPYLYFSFDTVFDQKSKQQAVYNRVATDIIDHAFQGINGTIFCYGQTASGKTYTCVGDDIYDEEDRGILPRLLNDVIQKIKENPSNIDTRAKISIVQIYNQKVTDLLDLSKRNLKLRENRNKGVFIEYVTEKYISRVQDGLNLLRCGIQNRSVGSTQMNVISSRSHMLFMITIIQNDFATGQAKSAKITIIDLAGSEKISKTGTQGKLLSEAIKINTSLSALGNVIHALSQNKSQHIPYRNSKLTRLLQESLGGNSLTSLIVNVSPSNFNQSETITSLRFGNRAKSIKNTPKINKQYTVQELLNLLEKAELKIKAQNKIIEEYARSRRGGNLGLSDRPLTLHILKDEQDDESLQDFYNPFQSNTPNKFKKSGLSLSPYSQHCFKSKKMSHSSSINQLGVRNTPQLEERANSTKDIEEQDGNLSCNSEQNLLEEEIIEREFIINSPKSQKNFLQQKQNQLTQQNLRLKSALDNLQIQFKEIKESYALALNSFEQASRQNKKKEQLIAKKNATIQKLKLKNQQRKAQIEKEINNLKKFWERYYDCDQEDLKGKDLKLKDLDLQHPLKDSDSTATLKNYPQQNTKRIMKVLTNPDTN